MSLIPLRAASLAGSPVPAPFFFKPSRKPAVLHRAALAALAGLALATSAARAQQLSTERPTERLDSVTTTATRTPQRLHEVLADLSVITRAEIERHGFASLGDLLAEQGAVTLVRNGGPAANTSLYLRGADTRHTVLLIDGLRVDSQATGGASWNAIPLDQIERIEILKGPASAIYGSDAIGGVVQVYTRKGRDGLRATLGAGVGNLGSSKLDASVSGRHGIFDLAASVAGERSTGFNATLDLPGSYSYVPDRDGYRNRNASLRVGAALDTTHRVELTALNSHVNGQFDLDAYSPTADDRALQTTRSSRLAWHAQWLAALQTELSVGESSERFETTPSPYLARTRIRQTGLTTFYRLDAGNQLQLIAERREDRLAVFSPYSPDLREQRSQTAIGAGWLASSGPLSWQLQGRHDDDSQFGGVNTGSLAAGYALTPALRLVGSWGNAFRAPTLYQRGSEYGPDLGKPGVKPLKAEHGRNIEFGLKWQDGHDGDSEASVTAYRNRVGNLIVFGDAGSCNSPYGCYQNLAAARLEGLSLRGATRVGALRLSGHLDWQSPTDEASGKLLPRRARQNAGLRADTEALGWQVGAALQASGKRWDNAGNTARLGGYSLLNLDAQTRLTADLRLQLRIDNLLDRAYQQAGGYAATPRTLFVGLRYGLGL